MEANKVARKNHNSEDNCANCRPQQRWVLWKFSTAQHGDAQSRRLLGWLCKFLTWFSLA